MAGGHPAIQFERCSNVSQLIRYCGFGTGPEGKAERRVGGPKFQPDGSVNENATGTYNAELKIKLVQAFVLGMRLANGKKPREQHRYLKRWEEAKHTALTIPNVRLGRVMRPGEADDKGRRKATDLFLWDLYVMGRTLAGLSIRPDKYSAIRGRYHNGQEAKDTTYFITLDEAKEMVGLAKTDQRM